MNDEEIKQLVSRKMFLINCFLYTSTLKPGENPELALMHGVTGYYLRSIILELFVKILYELDLKKQAPSIHNVLKIFNQLKEDTKSIVVSKYDEARERKVQIFKTVDPSVTFPSFQEVLSTNEAVVKNFKYDAMGAKSNSPVDGVFYQELVNVINERTDKIKNT